jgi:hypothetical protein
MTMLRTAAGYFMLGVCVVAGIRAAEWVIPQPELRMVVCLADDLGSVHACRTLNELLEASAQRGGKERMRPVREAKERRSEP